MAGAHFLTDLVVVLGVAALTTLLFQRLRQPVVLGYILAGVIIGPHVPIPLVADVPLVSTLSELGVILLMFSIGIEFSIPKIVKVGAPAAVTAVVQVGLMVALGYLVGRLFGWTGRESLFTGACLGISSTMLVAKAFEEQRLRGGFTELVFAVLVFEDLIAVLLLAILTAVASGTGLSPIEFAATAGKLAGFLAAMLVVGLLVVPRFVRLVVKLDRPETLLIASTGICFGMALLAERAGYSVALGAFLGGMLVAESGEGAKVEHLIHPFRDVFAAIFFVSVGMTVEPRLVARHWLAIVVLTVVVIVGKIVGVTAGAFLSGSGLRRSVRAGMSMAQIGEFSFIIAALGIAEGATRDFLLPVSVALCCITSLATPWLIRASDRAADLVDARLPRRAQTFVAFYSSWIDQIRSTPRGATRWSRLRRTVALLLVDAVALGAIVIGAAVSYEGLAAFLVRTLGIATIAAKVVIIVAACLLAGLFLFGVLRCAHHVARSLAAEVLPASADGQVDLGTAPRRALVLTLELAIVLLVGLPLVVAIEAFVATAVVVFVVIVLVIGGAAWRSIVSLHGHVRAGSQLIVETLARQSRQPAARLELDKVRELLPGIPGLSPIRLEANSGAVGKTLGQLNLRALTGATVLAINRGEEGTVLPSAGEVLRQGDLLVLAGPDEAIAAAGQLLATGAGSDGC